MAYNKVVLMGNLTRDPETRSTNSGQSVTNFSVAVNETWTGKDGSKQERTAFIECDAWAGRGETIAKYLHKGDPILVEGSLRQDNWEDKETGKKRSALRVSVSGFSFVGNRGGGSGNAGGDAPAPAAKDEPVIDVPEEGEVDLSEIPF
jgi:single-strand DNA-binding protein